MNSKGITRSQWRIIALSSIGGGLEFYDFAVFAAFALAIGNTFFPGNNPWLNTSLAFAVFATGYLARPIGGIILAHFGDKYGRKKVLVLTLAMMFFSTTLAGLTPSYRHWGITATFIFTALRLLQGLAIGGEIPTAVTFVKEHLKDHPALAIGTIFCCINLGILLAGIVHTVLQPYFSDSIAWRIAFVFGGLLTIPSYLLRLKLRETPQFLENAETREALPLKKLFTDHTANIVCGIFMTALQACLVSLFYLFTVSYMKLSHQYSNQEISKLALVNLVVFSLASIPWGFLGDRIGLRPIFCTAAILLVPLSILFYQALSIHHFVMPIYLMVSLVSAMVIGSLSAMLAHMFPTSVRLSGVSLCFNFGFAIFGGLSPLTASYLINTYHNKVIPGYLVAIIAICALIATSFAKFDLPKRGGKVLSQ